MKNPELRFKNDIDDWQEKELQDIATINKGQQLNKTVMVENGDYYVLNGGSSPSGKTNSFNTNENTISISEGGNSCGFVNLNKEKFWSGGHNYTLNKLNDNVDFIYQILKSNQDKIMDLRVGTGIPNIQRFNLEQFKITLSKDTTIQSQIATLLSDIDTKIETQEQKIEKLKVFKSAMLDKMFPKEGQKVPEIRFSGFSGDWEENVLGNVCETITDGAHNSPKEINRGYYMPSVKDMTNNGFDFSECKQISKNDFETLKKQGCMPKIGDILVSKDGSILSFCFSVKEKVNYVILSSIAIIRPKQILNNLFLEQYFKKDDFKNLTINQYSKGNALKRIVLKDFRTIKIQIPTTLEEQEKIGKYFEELDNKIELEISKLNKLKDMKNAMLNKLLS